MAVDELLRATEARADVPQGRLGMTVMIENPSDLVEIDATSALRPGSE